MPRKPRSLLGPGVYHVLNRGINRMHVFEAEDDKAAFLGLLKDYTGRQRVRVLHWVILSNHYHLVLDVDGPKTMTRFVWGLQRSYTASHHRRRREAGLDACGFLWQGRFKSTLVETDAYLLACGRYVERNPLRAGLVEIPWDYPWSSARVYALGLDDGLTSCDANDSYRSIGRNEDERAAMWREYLLDDAAKKEEALFQGGKSVIGSDPFKGRVLTRDGRPAYGKRGRPRKTEGRS